MGFVRDNEYTETDKAKLLQNFTSIKNIMNIMKNIMKTSPNPSALEMRKLKLRTVSWLEPISLVTELAISWIFRHSFYTGILPFTILSFLVKKLKFQDKIMVNKNYI